MTQLDNNGLDTRHYWAVTLLVCLAMAWSILPPGFAFGVDTQTDIDAEGGSLVRRLQWMPLFVLGAAIVWTRRDVSFALLRYTNPFLLAFLLWIAASMLWSPYPTITLRKVVLFSGVCLIALALAVAAWDRNRLMRLLRYSITFFLVVSVLMVFLTPHLGVGGPVGDEWRGATANKNHLGKVAGIGLLLWIQAIASRQSRWPIALPALGLSALVLVMAQSATSVVCVAPLIPLVWFMQRPPLALPRHGFLIVILLTFMILAPLAFVYLMVFGLPDWQILARPVAGAVDRSVTLTGRFEIWQRVLVEVAKHPWLGYGYGAFWLGANGPVPWITQNLYGIIWQAHNGYIDLLNETGMIGLALGVGFLCLHVQRTLTLAVYDRTNAAAQLAIFGFLILNNITESSVLRPGNFLFFLSVVASVDLSRSQTDIALRRVAARHRNPSVHNRRNERILPTGGETTKSTVAFQSNNRNS